MNGARGEVAVTLDGATHRLCLTLGALAEIETGLGVEGLDALAGRLRRLGAQDMTVVLAALLRGGGAEADRAKILASGAHPTVAAQAVSAAFQAAAR